MPHTLLLADDSVTVQRVIELTFAEEDVQVVAVSDGDQAIAQLQSHPPDIVLADVGMPGKDGYEVAQFIKRTPNLSHIPVLLLTGAFEPVDERRAAAAGCDGVLAKPFEPQLVIGRVRELLSRVGGNAPAVIDVAPTHQPTESVASVSGRRLPVLEDASAHAQYGMSENGPGSGFSSDLDDYFDRLDAAFANLSSSPLTPTDTLPPTANPEHDQSDWFTVSPVKPGAMPDGWEIRRPTSNREGTQRMDLPLSRTDGPRQPSPTPRVNAGRERELPPAPSPAQRVAELPPAPAHLRTEPVAIETPSPIAVEGSHPVAAAPPHPVAVVPPHPVVVELPHPVAAELPQPVAVELPHPILIEPSVETPVRAVPVPQTPVAVAEAVSAPPTPALATLPALPDAFAALLADEQINPASEGPRTWPSPNTAPAILTDDLIEQVTRRVLERFSDAELRARIADIVSATAERLVMQEIERIKASIR